MQQLNISKRNQVKLNLGATLVALGSLLDKEFSCHIVSPFGFFICTAFYLK